MGLFQRTARRNPQCLARWTRGNLYFRENLQQELLARRVRPIYLVKFNKAFPEFTQTLGKQVRLDDLGPVAGIFLVQFTNVPQHELRLEFDIVPKFIAFVPSA